MPRTTTSRKSRKRSKIGDLFHSIGSFLGVYGKETYGRINIAAEVLLLIVILSCGNGWTTLCEAVTSLKAGVPYDATVDGIFDIGIFFLATVFCMYFSYRIYMRNAADKERIERRARRRA